MNTSSSDNKALRKRLVAYFSKQEVKSSDFEQDALLFDIKRSIRARQRKRLRIAAYSFASAAAVVLIALFLHHRSGMGQDMSSYLAQSQGTSEEIRLILSSEREISVGRGSEVEYTKDGIKVGGVLAFDYASARKHESLDKIIVPNGTYTKLILSDGTVMHVNSGTSVVFPRQFKQGSKREIFVDGEAFLDVARDESAPFIVNTYNFNVKVLGTEFNIHAYSEYPDKQSVVLASGKVSLSTKSGEEVAMAPNQKVAISSDGILEHSEVKASDYIQWTKGILCLQTASLKDNLTRLGRYYNATISYAESIEEVELEGKIDLGQGIEATLKHLAEAGNLRLEKTESGYFLDTI